MLKQLSNDPPHRVSNVVPIYRSISLHFITWGLFVTPRRPNRDSGVRVSVVTWRMRWTRSWSTLSPYRREERKMENRRHAKHTFRFDVDNGHPPDVSFFPLRRYASAMREDKSRRLLPLVNSKSWRRFSSRCNGLWANASFILESSIKFGKKCIDLIYTWHVGKRNFYYLKYFMKHCKLINIICTNNIYQNLM